MDRDPLHTPYFLPRILSETGFPRVPHPSLLRTGLEIGVEEEGI